MSLRIRGVTLVLALLACGRALAQEDPPPPRPSPEEIRLAVHPAHRPPKGARQEALGRLVFEVPREMEWGIIPPTPNGLEYGFGGGYARVNNILITVVGPVPKTELLERLNVCDARKDNGIHDLERSIEGWKSLVNDLETTEPEKKTPGLLHAIQRHQNDIKDAEARIKAITESWHPYDLGLPDSSAYLAGSTLYAYLWRDGFLHSFMSGQAVEGPSVETRQPPFDVFVKAYRPRKLYEIPTEPGICVPYGFIPDNGTMAYNLQIGLRFKDAPGVIYTLATRTFGPEGPIPDWTRENTRRAAGIFPLDDSPRMRRIGPAKARIGALEADQGGRVVPQEPLGKGPKAKPYELYVLYTGRGGYALSQALPGIGLYMAAEVSAPGPGKGVKRPPPPFKVSQPRYQGLLDSLRLRPTTPPMPELQALEGKAGGGTGK